MHRFLCFGAYCEQCNICKRETQVRQLSKFHYRLVRMCTKTLKAKTHNGYTIIDLKYFLLLQFIIPILEYSSSYAE